MIETHELYYEILDMIHGYNENKTDTRYVNTFLTNLK